MNKTSNNKLYTVVSRRISKHYVNWFTFLIVVVFISTLLPQANAAKRSKLPMRVQMILLKVKPLVESHSHSKAIKILEEFRSKQKYSTDSYNHAEINFVLGNCYLQQENPIKASSSYLRVLDRDPNHPGAYQNLAKAYYDMEQYNDAGKAFYKSFQRLEEKNPETLYFSAVAYLMGKKYDLSLQHFTSLINNYPESVTLQWKENLVYCLVQTQKVKQAIPYMVELSQKLKGKKQTKWQQILLQQYLALNMKRKALQLAERLTQETPTTPTWWKALAHIHLASEDYKKGLAAMTVYSFLVSLQPEEEKLLGDLYLQQGIPQKAVKRYEKCLEQKVNKENLLQLARSYIDLDKHELALKMLSTLAPDSQDQDIIIMRGEIFYSMKKYNQASKIFEHAGKLMGKHSSRAFLMAGYSYWQEDDNDKALAHFKKAAQSKWYKKEASNAIKQLIKVKLVQK